MSALPITITTAGLQALINAQNTGVSNVVIAQIGVSAVQTNITAATTAVPNEVKRLGAVAGQVTAKDTFYVSVADQSADTYAVRTIGLYLNNGVLFGGYSQALPLVEKAAPSMVVLEAAIKLASPLASGIQFSGGGWLNPPASETVEGILRLATEAEAVQGLSHSRAVTPKGLKGAIAAYAATVQAAFDAINRALSGKAPLDSPDFTGAPRLPAATLFKMEAPGSAEGGQIILERSATSTIAGNVVVDVAGDDVRIYEAAAPFRGLRIPLLSQGAGVGSAPWTNSNFDPAGKSNTDHRHDASHTTTGVFDVGRIPALAMAKITGLAAALALKADLNSPSFTGLLSAVRVQASDEIACRVSGGGFVRLRPGTADRTGYVEFHRADGARMGYIGYGDATNTLHFVGDNGVRYRFVDRPLFGSATPWDSSNFDPGLKSNTDHRHDASHTTTGVFDVGRIPALAMAKVTGLATALAAKADLNSPDFTGAPRLPAATLFKMEAPGSPEGGQIILERSDTSTIAGNVVIDVAGDDVRIYEAAAPNRGLRIPLLNQAGAVGSVPWTTTNFDPAGKSDTDHRHDASHTTTGVFDVGRIPALAMAKVTGLATALAAKADLANPIFSGSVRNTGNNFELPGDGSYLSFNLYYSGGWRLRSAGQGWAVRHSGSNLDVSFANTGPAGEIIGLGVKFRVDGVNNKAYVNGAEVFTTANFDPAAKANLKGGAEFEGTVGVRGPIVVRRIAGDPEGGEIRLEGAGSDPTITIDSYQGSLRVYAAGMQTLQLRADGGYLDNSRIWTAANFDPAAKANADDAVLKSATHIGRTGGGPLSEFGTPQQYGDQPTGFMSMMTAASAGLPGGFGYLSKLGRRDNSNGWGGLFITHVANAGDRAEVFVGATPTGDAYPTWSRLWSNGNDDRTGSIVLFGCDYAPAGYLKCNGAAVSRTTYAALFGRIGTRHGGGDGSTTFNLPDLRGEFLRGWDDGRGTDAGRGLGSWQAQDIQSHTHQTVVGQAAGGGSSGLYSSGDDYTGTLRSYVDTLAAGGAETRPRNVAFLACIKF